jgi:hypothetical protein
MIRDCFDSYIELFRNNPMGATLITGCVLFVIGACIHSAFFESSEPENRENTDHHNY